MELHELLVKFGFSRGFTKVLLYCIQHKDEMIRMRDVERVADLRQPEVSLAMQQLVDRKWVKVNILPGSGKRGHPGKSYCLAIPVEKIAKSIFAEIDQRIAADRKLAGDIQAIMMG